MNTLKNKILCLVPPVIGLYCAVQGLLLIDNPDPLVQAFGISLFLWVPGCAYFSWKARTAASRAEARTVARPETAQHAPAMEIEALYRQ